MTFTCLNGRIFCAGFFSIVAVCLLHCSDATLPIPLLGGNGTSLIPGLNFNPFANSPQLQTLQRNLNRASNFLMHYANLHAQNTVTSLSQGQFPRLPLAELALRTLSGGGASGASSGAGLRGIGDAIGGIIGSLGNAANGAGTGSGISLGGIRPTDSVTVTLAPDPPSDVVRSGPVTVTLAPDPPSVVVRSGPVTVTLPPDPASGDDGAPAIDIRSIIGGRSVRAVMGGDAGIGVDRAGDFQQ